MKGKIVKVLIIMVTFTSLLVLPEAALAQNYLNMNLLSQSGLGAEDIDKVFSKTPLEGLGKDFVQVEEKFGINSQFFAALAILESDWGRSKIAREKNNFFGFGAHDKAPYRLARKFNSKSEGIRVIACFIKNEYLSPDGQYFNGSTLPGMNKKYASDSLWAQKVANRMKLFVNVKEEKKDLKKPKEIQRKEVNEMNSLTGLLSTVKAINPTIIYIELAISVLIAAILINRKNSVILLVLTAVPVALAKTIGFVLKQTIIAFGLSIWPALKKFCAYIKKDITKAWKMFKMKRKYKKIMRQEAKKSIQQKARRGTAEKAMA